TPFGRRLRPRYRPRRLAARPSQGGRGSLGRESPPGVPVFQRHPRQCGCAPDGGVTTIPEWPAAIVGGPFAARAYTACSADIPSCARAREAIAATPEDR